MATEIIMPKVDMVMESGTFVEWLKQEGDAIQKGEPLFVMMTDKAAIEVEAPEGGILAGLKAKPEDIVPVTEVIGYILQPGELLPETIKASEKSDRVPPEQALAEKTKQVLRKGADISGQPRRVGEGLLRATPLARSLARELHLDLRQVPGSGPRGRIYKEDVERYVNSSSITRVEDKPVPTERKIPTFLSPASLKEAQITLPIARERGRIALKGPRALIAQRMAYSAATIPHIHLTIQVDMSEAGRMREKLNPVFEKQFGVHISYTAMIARAVVNLLVRHPYLNSSLIGDEIILWEDVHLGIATDLGEYLVVPVVREAQEKNLEKMVLEIEQLVEKARSRKLHPSEMTGSTFSISNLGMKGIASFTAIINPPETGILAIGKILDTPVAQGAGVAIRPVMTLTLAVDHRVVDGAQAANFLADLKEILENPYLLI